MRLQLLLLVSIIIFCTGCGKKDDYPTRDSSGAYRFNGSHLIQKIGVPATSTTLQLPLKSAPTTTPVPLPLPDSETFIIAQGSDIVIGNSQSVRILTHSPDSTDIIELLVDSNSIYAIHLGGKIECWTRAGKAKWNVQINNIPKLGSALTSRSVIICTDNSLMAFDHSTGAHLWNYHSLLTPQSVCLTDKGEIILALTTNDLNSSDSIILFSDEGGIIRHWGFVHSRITSNLTYLALNRTIAFGYLHLDDSTSDRTAHLMLWSIDSQLVVEAQKPDESRNLHWDNKVPYIVSTVSATSTTIISGGFRETAGEIISGIDAFYNRTGKMYWHRRFAYPLVNPVAVSDAYAYIPFTFSTQAAIATKTILMTIDLGDGKTYSELPITGSTTGFVQGIGMPIEGMLVYADRNVPQLYFLKP